jgi:hypothetical protein
MARISLRSFAPPRFFPETERQCAVALLIGTTTPFSRFHGTAAPWQRAARLDEFAGLPQREDSGIGRRVTARTHSLALTSLDVVQTCPNLRSDFFAIYLIDLLHIKMYLFDF